MKKGIKIRRVMIRQMKYKEHSNKGTGRHWETQHHWKKGVEKGSDSQEKNQWVQLQRDEIVIKIKCPHKVTSQVLKLCETSWAIYVVEGMTSKTDFSVGLNITWLPVKRLWRHLSEEFDSSPDTPTPGSPNIKCTFWKGGLSWAKGFWLDQLNQNL